MSEPKLSIENIVPESTLWEPPADTPASILARLPGEAAAQLMVDTFGVYPPLSYEQALGYVNFRRRMIVERGE